MRIKPPNHGKAVSKLGGPCRKKDPVTSDIIIELCDSLRESQDLCTVRNLCMITLAYSGFLRFNELSNIRCKNLSLQDDYLKLNIPKSKTDQYRHGCEILISKGLTSACPVTMLQRYMSLANLEFESDSFLFKAVNKTKSGAKLIFKDKKLSYTRAKECIVSLFKSVDQNLNVGLHSLRPGGVSTAANNEVNDRCLKRHGRWKTEVLKMAILMIISINGLRYHKVWVCKLEYGFRVNAKFSNSENHHFKFTIGCFTPLTLKLF